MRSTCLGIKMLKKSGARIRGKIFFSRFGDADLLRLVFTVVLTYFVFDKCFCPGCFVYVCGQWLRVVCPIQGVHSTKKTRTQEDNFPFSQIYIIIIIYIITVIIITVIISLTDVTTVSDTKHLSSAAKDNIKGTSFPLVTQSWQTHQWQETNSVPFRKLCDMAFSPVPHYFFHRCVYTNWQTTVMCFMDEHSEASCARETMKKTI